MSLDLLTGDLVEKLGFSPDELHAKYRSERDKRLREEGNEQYIEITNEFADYNNDPYTERIERAPLNDEVQRVILLEEWRATGRLEGVELS